MLLRRFAGALVLDPSAFEDIEHDPGANLQAMLVVVTVCLAGGVGAMGLGLAGVSGFVSGSIVVLGGWLVWVSAIFAIGTVTLAEADTRPLHAGIAVPTLIITGEHDGIVPPGTAATLQAVIPGAQFVTIPGVGHLSGQEDPATYNAALRAFLERTR